MASELFTFDNTFFTDPFSPYTESSTNYDHHSFLNIQESSLVVLDDDDSISIGDDENLSIYQTTHFPNNINTLPFISTPIYSYSDSYGSLNSFGTATNEVKSMERSFSSDCFADKLDFNLFRPRFESVVESPNLENQVVNVNFNVYSPQSSLSCNVMNKVCSLGDLRVKTTSNGRILSSIPDQDAVNSELRPYNAEERKERIEKYRAKRTQRNFNKKIKYVCRKTLADHRPRIRGRFARNDEAGELSKTPIFSNTYGYPNDNDLWVNGVQEEEEEESYKMRASIYNGFHSTHYQNYKY